MEPHIELVNGNMFHGPADLVVIPMSTKPAMTPFVQEHLRNFDIPAPRTPMSAGEVRFEQLEQASQVAQCAAFAAAVETGGPRPNADLVRRVGEELGRFATKQTWVNRVSCPLLGAGAGRVDVVASFQSLRDGLRSSLGRSDVMVRLFVMDGADYRRLGGQLTPGPTIGTAPNPDAARAVRVFLSYAWSSESHRSWVRSLAKHLRESGIESRLDHWHLRPGMNRFQWMCNELDMADRVVMVCDELYKQRADRLHGGVGWEVRLIQGELATRDPEMPPKCLPVVRAERFEDALPRFLPGEIAFPAPPSSGRADEDRFRRALVAELNQTYEKAPPVDPRPRIVMTATQR